LLFFSPRAFLVLAIAVLCLPHISGDASLTGPLTVPGSENADPPKEIGAPLLQGSLKNIGTSTFGVRGDPFRYR
jgi:hypothetical protein